jgi:hypothetical protein
MKRKRGPPPMNVQPSVGRWDRQAIPMGPSKDAKGKTRAARSAISPSNAEIARKASLNKQRKLLEAVRTKRPQT